MWTKQGLVSDFIAKMETKRDKTDVDYYRTGYEMCRDAASKHQSTYGQSQVEDLVHYLDSLSALDGLNVMIAYTIQQSATALHRRLDITTTERI